MFADEIPFAQIVHPTPNALRDTTLAPAVPPDSAEALLAQNPTLQILFSRFTRCKKHTELLPQGCNTQDAAARRAMLETLFEKVEACDQFGRGVFEFRVPRQAALGAWSSLLNRRALDPLLQHFSYSHADRGVRTAHALTVYQLCAEPGECPEDALCEMERQPWTQAMLSNDLLVSNCPVIDVTGWQLEELLHDRALQLFSGLVSRLYYLEWEPGYHLSQQIRYAL